MSRIINGHCIAPYSDLSEANLRYADLSEANLSGANLRYADLSEADLQWANLSKTKGIISFGPVGYEGRIGYAVKHKTCIMVKLGCFWGRQDDAVQAVNEKYGHNSSYASIINACCNSLK
jgi:hypothetical protein